MSNKPGSEAAGVELIDILFTVGITISFTPEVLNLPFKGLLSERWLQNGSFPSSTAEWCLLSVFVLAFANLTLSWFGYHASILTRPLNFTKLPGLFRFLLDVTLVVLYVLMILLFRHPHSVFFLLLVVFALYCVWDLLKIWEYSGEYASKTGTFAQKYRRELVTYFWTLVSLVLFLLSYLISIRYIVPSELVALFLYRVNKSVPMWWEYLVGYRR